MIKLIQAACQWGQKDFDGWVIGKARYCFHSQSEPASYESIPKKTAPGYVLLETTLHMIQTASPANLLKFVWWTLRFSGIPEEP